MTHVTEGKTTRGGETTQGEQESGRNDLLPQIIMLNTQHTHV